MRFIHPPYLLETLDRLTFPRQGIDGPVVLLASCVNDVVGYSDPGTEPTAGLTSGSPYCAASISVAGLENNLRCLRNSRLHIMNPMRMNRNYVLHHPIHARAQVRK
jgi:hypothetical protein